MENIKRDFSQTTAATDFMGVHFNWTKCAPLPNTGLGSWRPKVYVPPADDETDLLSSVVYQKILTAIREGPHHTGDPDEACLFVLGIDTIDRDKLRLFFLLLLCPFCCGFFIFAKKKIFFPLIFFLHFIQKLFSGFKNNLEQKTTLTIRGKLLNII
jgi:hypothetical protein